MKFRAVFPGIWLTILMLILRGEASSKSGYLLFGGTDSDIASEPNVIAENGILKMWYTAGWNAPEIYYRTSSDGFTWSSGVSVFSTNSPAHAIVVKFEDTYYLYYVNAATNDLHRATSKDGIAWSDPTLIFAHNAFDWETQWGNPCIWRDGDTWRGFFEYLQPSGNWQLAYFTSADGLHWRHITHPILSLQPTPGGDVGGPFILYEGQKRDGLYHLVYHGNTNPTGLPTDIYYATSPDTVTWTIQNGRHPILAHSGIDPEYDQIADPVIVEFHGKTFIYFDAMNNNTPAGYLEAVIWSRWVRRGN